METNSEFNNNNVAYNHNPYYQSINPNDEFCDLEYVRIKGKGPGMRAGHSATVYGRKLIIFGGSHHTDYLSDFYVLDTDPVPETKVTLPTVHTRLPNSLVSYMNSSKFSDFSVTS